ncbi:putative RNA methylase UPF0020 [Halocaridina rubra]|uniref:RNA methylase UPF0020 n=1 Tax=Halocaridina rubra TaxID=373956 RepID=A0AAN8X6Z7_HALRR
MQYLPPPNPTNPCGIVMGYFPCSRLEYYVSEMEIPFFVTCGRGLDQFVIDEIYEKFPKALNVHSLGEGKVAFAIRAALVADNCKISENCSVPENKTFETDVTHHEAGSLESIAAVYRLKLVERIFYLIHCENVRDNYIDENNLRTIIGTKDLNSIASLVVSLKKQHISQEVSKNCCEPKSCQGTLNWKAKKDKIKNYMNSVTYNDKEMQNRVNESNLKRPNDLADCNNISPSKKICEMDSECCSKSSFSEVHENIYDEKPENISSSLIKPEDSYCDPKALVAVKNKESCQCILKLSNSKGICMCVREKASLPYDNQPKFQDQHKNYSLVTFRISSRISGKHKRLLSYSSVIAVFVKFMEDCKYGWVTEWINPTLDFYVNVTDSHFLIGVTLSKEPLSLRPYITHITLRSTISHLMAKLCKISSGGILLDPMCGGGTILVEAAKCFKVGLVIGGDMKREQLAVARCNLLGLGISFSLMLCQAINIPLKDCSINAVVCDFPFGKKHKLNEDEKTLLYGVLKECSRLLKADGRAVLLISEQQRNILVHFLTSNKSSVESNELNLNIEFVYPLSLGRTAALLAVLLKV